MYISNKHYGNLRDDRPRFHLSDELGIGIYSRANLQQIPTTPAAMGEKNKHFIRIGVNLRVVFIHCFKKQYGILAPGSGCTVVQFGQQITKIPSITPIGYARYWQKSSIISIYNLDNHRLMLEITTNQKTPKNKKEQVLKNKFIMEIL